MCCCLYLNGRCLALKIDRKNKKQALRNKVYIYNDMKNKYNSSPADSPQNISMYECVHVASLCNVV